LIEKVSGCIKYVDVTFGGFLGSSGVHHYTIPWTKLAYDREFGGYRTDISEARVRGAPTSHGDEEIWHDREREKQMQRYWDDGPRGPI